MIRCDLIDTTEDPSRDRAKRKTKNTADFVKKMAESLKKHGQLQAIGLMPAKEDGRHELIWGRRRLRGAVLNGWEEIESFVIVVANGQNTEATAIEENLRRDDLTQAERFAGIRRLSEIWASEHDDLSKVRSEAGKKGGRGNKKAKDTAPSVQPSEPQEEPGPVPFKSEVVAVAEETGRGLTVTRESLRIAKRLTPEQVSVMEVQGVNAGDLYAISGIKDEEKRSLAVNLAASGMNVSDAIATAEAGEVTKSDADEKLAEKEMTDEQWLEAYCSDFRKMLGSNTVAYDVSATFYREINKARGAFEAKIRKALAEAMSCTPHGHFVRFVNQLCHIEHPRDWLLCAGCSGAGSVAGPTGQASKCIKCSGDGFKVKQGAPPRS